MGRLKKDHSGWHSHGLYLKYQQPTVEEPTFKHKRKKNTNKWCKGKVGREHDLLRIFYRTYNNGRGYEWDYYNNKLYRIIITRCMTCGKEFWSNKGKNIPLVIPVRLESVKMPVQVKVNGKAVPIDYREYETNRYWCSACQMWELK